MNLCRIYRGRHRRQTDPQVGVAGAVCRALWLAGLCIAAFESSQLVFHSATLPSWADPSEQMARARVDPTGTGEWVEADRA